MGTRNKTLLLSIFVLSGFAGLVYQSIWSQYLGNFLGHAAYAQALVLAIFMGGMAIGAIWIARVGEGWRNLIRSYAYVEAMIGLLGLLFHVIFIGVTNFGYEKLIPMLGSGGLTELARWGMSSVLILPQTILLGMTFPLMSGGLIRRYPHQDGRALGGLYFTNSAGAAVGALVATFVLLPQVGLPGAVVTAGFLNLVVAALAFWIARAPEPLSQISRARQDNSSGQSSHEHSQFLRIVLISTAISGAVSFAYEIIWIRMLSLAVGSTLHAFELMLASFIGGIALGGLWVRKHADRAREPISMVGWMQIAMGVAALLSLAVYANAFRWVGWLLTALSLTDGGYAMYTLGTAVVAMAIMLPAAFFAGTTLPLFTVALLRNGHGERAIGQVYGWNTIGTIAGVFVTMHWLIPMIGLKLALVAAALVDMLVGLFLLRLRAQHRRDFWRLGAAAAAVLVCIWMSVVHVPLDPAKLASGVFRLGTPELDSKTASVVYYRDGKTASVSVTNYSKEKIISIATNGKADAAIRMVDNLPPIGDEKTMALLAGLPLGLHMNPEFIGVIGFGSGMTTHTLLGDARVKRVDTIEIEPAMIGGARAFGSRVDRAFKDKRSNIIIDDAKSYFSSQASKYDIIISEPSNPWISGVGGLFAREFYDFVPRHLNDNGLFVQWLQLYEIDDQLVASIINGLTPAFSDYSAWLANSGDMIIVATPKGRLPAFNADHILNGVLSGEFARLGISNAAHVDVRRVATGPLLRGYGALYKTKENSYYYPLLSLEAPRTRFRKIMANTFPMLAGDTLMLEALDIREPLKASVITSSYDDWEIEQATRLARVNGEFLRGKPIIPAQLKGLDSPIEPAMLLMDVGHRICRNPSDESLEQILAVQLNKIAYITLSLLDKDLQQGVLIDPQWMPCDPAVVSSDAKRAFDFLAAQARRDWTASRQLGEDWIKNPPKGNWRQLDQLALSAVLIDLAREKKWAELLNAEEKLGKSIQPTGAHMVARMLLHGMADYEQKIKQP